MLMFLIPLLAFPVYGQAVPEEPEATAWEQVGKNRWRSNIIENGISIAEMFLSGETVMFRVTQACKPNEKVAETTLEWNAGDEVGTRRDCAGRTGKHVGRTRYLEEKVFKPYPKEVEKILHPKPKIKIPPRPSIENMHMTEPLHEARRANAPGFFFAP